MGLLKYILPKITICIIIGIAIAKFLTIPLKILLGITLISGVWLSVLWLQQRKHHNKNFAFGILALGVCIVFGAVLFTLHNDTLRPNHYTFYSQITSSESTFEITITKRLKQSEYYNKFIAEVAAINQKTYQGKVLINLAKSHSINFNVGDQMLIKSTLKNIPEPLNPHVFNYKEFMEAQNVFGQFNVNPLYIKRIDSSTWSIHSWADNFRNQLVSNLKLSAMSADAVSIFNALVLGQRDGIAKDTYLSFINAGVVHVLAVSGLHVGILLYILLFLSQPLRYFKFGRYLQPVIIVLCLWCFAVITGLSPSVNRAVTMFSIVCIGRYMNRHTNIYNTLCFSALIMLIYEPALLFNISFQLSYIAVFGIVTIHPLLHKHLASKNKIINYFTTLVSVSFAAQLAVLPLSLYYFHHFPSLFLMTNIIAIPLVTLLLITGLALIVALKIVVVPNAVIYCFNQLSKGLINYVDWVASFDSMIVKHVELSEIEVVLLYGVIISLICWLNYKTHQGLMFICSFVIGLQVVSWIKMESNSNTKLIIFNSYKNLILGIKTGPLFSVYSETDSLSTIETQNIKSYRIGEGIKDIRYKALRNVSVFKENTLLIVDSLGIYNNLSFNVDYVLLHRSPKLHLNRLINTLQPKAIIITSANYNNVIERWVQTCKRKNISYHLLKSEGAFIIE